MEGQTGGIDVWTQKTFCLITGASRGYGNKMATMFASRLPADSFLLLVARDAKGLASAKDVIRNERPDVYVHVWSADLTQQNASSFDSYLRELFNELSISPSNFEQAILVHNAGTLGNVSQPFCQQTDCNELNTYWQMNLTSVVILNSIFWKHFHNAIMKQRIVIQISSICALQPFKSWSLYCASKAARDMLFLTMAQEEPSIRVLTYAPGPLDTEMQLEGRTYTSDPEIQAIFTNLHAEGRLLSCEQSLNRLIALLAKNKFSSGSHIDYYDLTDDGEPVAVCI